MFSCWVCGAQSVAESKTKCQWWRCPLSARTTPAVLTATQLAELDDLPLISLARERKDDLLVQALANRIEDLTNQEP